MTDTFWHVTADETPPEGVLLDVITESGMQTELVFSRGLFFTPDRSMYVYYVPQFWREKP
ncbi:hypothetical protein [Streptomyces sp. AC495_CC817]|uniref:hypothetical protein n=1 Tax=Streptomyces sp. AC495_CC817 TaxID=2823900 RepID=UPI001C270C10|nr:hypothetical protein [Streptomyces sp. AC495_CC817]